jgi:hypothetical protein
VGRDQGAVAFGWLQEQLEDRALGVLTGPFGIAVADHDNWDKIKAALAACSTGSSRLRRQARLRIVDGIKAAPA